MSDKLPFMPFFVNDYLSDTTHLNCKEHGAYLLLLFCMWKNDGTLPCDDVALSRFARLPIKQWKQMRANIISFFEVTGAVLSHKRIRAEKIKIEKLSHTRSQVGKSGAEAKRLKSLESPEAIASDLLKQTPSKPQPSHTSYSISNNLQAVEPVSAPSEPDKSRAALCVSLGEKITDLMGVTNDPKWLGNWSVVSVWLAQGYDAELDIMPTVRASVESRKRTNKAMPGSLNYFSRAIEENYKARTANGHAAAINPELVTVRKGSPQFKAWIAYYKKSGRRTAFSETQDVLTVPTEYPNGHHA